ncbi:MAG: DNA replication complex GINS family protein [Candidatus Aenigmarchaeota archaeon]|nr:DNA replication complex GINS family protein [Candidatus Aenigmarchaeota archaeon]
MLTFEKIRDMERMEKNSKNLQKLPENFLKDVKEYLEIKRGLDILEVESARNTVKRLFELREQKLVNLALYSARTNMPVENLTEREMELFSRITDSIKSFRVDFDEPYSVAEKPAEKERRFRVMKHLPEFIGPDMKTYTLNKGDVTVLPDELAELLAKNGIVERV